MSRSPRLPPALVPGNTGGFNRFEDAGIRSATLETGIITTLILWAAGGAAWAGPGSTAGLNLQHIQKLKPKTIRPALTVPSSETVREVGGIRYGRHRDIKLRDGTTVRCFPEATKDPTKTSKTTMLTEVNPDDPFFQRREMRFIIDNEAYDIFNEMVNYATVQVRVPRKDQRPFIDELTIDQKYLENNGQTATLTYTRMGDDTQTYDDAVQWSLRGGHLYPSKPR
ncbi:MAG: hypothetical protein ACOCTS_04335, partial [Thermodesulfobacteriota bacterium]